MVTKVEIAGILGLTEADISDLVYTYAKEQFYVLIGKFASETSKTYRQFMKRDSKVVKLPYDNIKSIDTIKYDDETQTGLSNFDGYILNQDTGMVRFQSFIGSGTFVELTYTINAFTHTEISNLLIALLTYKGIAVFTPETVGQVKSVRIGNYSKTYAGIAKDFSQFLENLNVEINRIKAQVLGDGGNMSYGEMGG